MKNLNGARCVVLACALLVSGFAVGANGVQARHDDFVRRVGDPVTGFGLPPTIVIPARAHYLLTGAEMRSSVTPANAKPFEMWFRGFVNRTPYTLVISLNYLAVPRDPHGSVGVVNNVPVNWSSNVSTFEVPPGAEYGFNTYGSYAISAWVVGSFEDKKQIRENLRIAVGLPSANDFANPVFNPKQYSYCANTVNAGQIQSTDYVYLGRYSDGIVGVGGSADTGVLGLGPRPAQPGVCALYDLTPVVGPDNSDNSGGGGTGDGDN
jgi:hypothetical protein